MSTTWAVNLVSIDSLPHLVMSSSRMTVVGSSSLVLGPDDEELAFSALLLDDFFEEFSDDFFENFLEDLLKDLLNDFLEDFLEDFFEDSLVDFLEDFLDSFEKNLAKAFRRIFSQAAHWMGLQQRSSRAKVK